MTIKDLAIKKLGKEFPKLYIYFKISDKKLAKQTMKGYDLILKNNLFDKDFYLKNYPKLKNSDLDLLLHYIFFGFYEGKNPSKDFDSVFYKNQYEDARVSNLNPLIHYVLYGEGRLTKLKNKPLKDYINPNKKRILYLLHEKIGTVGGTGYTNLDIIDDVKDEYQCFILTSTEYEVELWEVKEDKYIKIANDVSYLKIIDELKVDLVHINHLIHYKISDFKVPYILSIHDFYYLCPSIHLIDENYKFCEFNCSNCKYNMDVHQNKYNKILENAYKLIFPSNSTMGIYKKFYPKLDNFELIEHGRDFKSFKKINHKFTNPLKIAFIGHISQHKGSLFIKDIKKEDKKNKLKFYFVGTSIPPLKDCGIIKGRYERDNLIGILNEINPSMVAILSTCPETFSHTLTEAWYGGYPVITTNLGALASRNKDYGWLVDYKDAKKAYNQIIQITENDYNEKLQKLNEIKFKSKEEMTSQYKKIYRECLNG